MKRRHIILNVLLIILLVLTSCYASNPSGSSDSSKPVASSSTSDETVNSKEDLPDDDSRPRIVWAVNFHAYISEDVQVQIQNFLDEKGIDCKIEFTPLIMEGGAAYEKWLNGQKEAGTMPDILTGCLWEHGVLDLAAFVKKELLPLNSYLESEAGQELYDAYAEVEWNRTKVDGVIYSIPVRQRQYQNTQGRFYLCVNDEYKSFFDAGFDGTYASLRKIVGAIPGSPKIAMVPSFDMNYAYSFYQTQLILYATYCWEREEFVDLTKQNDFKELLLNIYADYQSGVLVDIESEEQVNGNACAYVGFSGELRDYYDIPEDYTEYVLAPEMYLSAPGAGSYGISAFSGKKDLAFQVLSACYSDPKIASLIFWRTADEDRWNERTRFLKTCEPSPLNNFIPDITLEEWAIIRSYNNDLNTLEGEFYLQQSGNSVKILNPNFPNAVDQFFSSPKDYGTVIEKISDQIRKWINKK
ncbi:MAG: hypothetical protein IKS10_01825 [Lachnospiraceae bacterium]|nr:hypothetical protein [Lachnospiraceae bacterium]